MNQRLSSVNWSCQESDSDLCITKWIEGPDSDIDRIIRSVRENGGQLSGKLLKEFPPLAQAPVGQQVVAAIDAVFSGPS